MTSQQPDIAAVRNYLLDLQARLCAAVEGVEDGARFREDRWTRPEGGGGQTRVLSEGAVMEQAGINFSHVLGGQLPPSATAQRPELAGCAFQALGVSLVFHPRNPHVPTTHANVRLFVAERPTAAPIWWFGGGFDLTPYYPVHEDVLHWHRTARAACTDHAPDAYDRFKNACDRYFYLPHRAETRGVGGTFLR